MLFTHPSLTGDKLCRKVFMPFFTLLLWLIPLWALLGLSFRNGGASALVGAASLPPTLLSSRVVDQCVDKVGPAPCVDGTIAAFDASVDGRVVAFVSNSNRLVASDGNNAMDIFLWREGEALRRVSVGMAGEEGNHHSDRLTLSGNGHYLYFRSQAGNLVDGTNRGDVNLYVKEIATGRLALISRGLDGNPINGLIVTQHFSQLDSSYNGRYVVFSSSAHNYLDYLHDTNNQQDIFLADVDPDGNGDYFDSAPQIHALSVEGDGITTGNFASFEPSMSQDGSAIVWLTRATNLADGLDSNGSAPDALLARYVRLANGQVDPAFDVATRTLIAINRIESGADTLTPQGARLARIDPWRDQVAFVTADDLPASGDEHAGEDVYLSVGSMGNASAREIVWVSHAYSTTSPLALSLGWDPVLPPAAHSQVAWVAQSDARTVDDLLIQRAAPFAPTGWKRMNWVDVDMPSTQSVIDGALSADGRFAFWTTTEDYGVETPTETVNLFRRDIAAPQSVGLTVHAVGGAIGYQPLGTQINDTMHYSATTVVTMTAQAQAGYRFREWVDVDEIAGTMATVNVYAAREVTALFDVMTRPQVADVALTMAEDSIAQEFTLAIIDADPDEQHQVLLVDGAAHGSVTIHDQTIRYLPARDFYGQDRFTLQVVDAYGLQLAQAAQVNVTVTPVNDPPVEASAWGVGFDDDAAIFLTVTVVDVDVDDSYTLAVEAMPAHGSVAIVTRSAAQHFLYYPNGEFTGFDPFTFRAIDSANASITGTATITINGSLPVTHSTTLLHLPMLRHTMPESPPP